MALKPATAVRIEQGAMNEVAIDLLAIGDLLLVRPGELIPADGKVCRGESAVNQASITGESLPVEKTAGSEVFAGTVNGEGPLYIEVTKAAENTLLPRLLRWWKRRRAKCRIHSGLLNGWSRFMPGWLWLQRLH